MCYTQAALLAACFLSFSAEIPAVVEEAKNSPSPCSPPHDQPPPAPASVPKRIPPSPNSDLRAEINASHSQDTSVVRGTTPGWPKTVSDAHATPQANDQALIVVVGQKQAGKSTLVNAILGEALAEVGEETQAYASMLKPQRFNKGSLEVVEAVGYDDTSMSLCDSSLQQVEQFALGVNPEDVLKSDLIVLCSRPTHHPSIDSADSLAIAHLKKVYGESVFARLIVVQTKANTLFDQQSHEVVPYQSSDDNPLERYKRAIVQRTSAWSTLLSKTVGPDIADNIRIIPAGEHPHQKLFNKEDWHSIMWGEFSCLAKRCRARNLLYTARAKERDPFHSRRISAADMIHPTLASRCSDGGSRATSDQVMFHVIASMCFLSHWFLSCISPFSLC